MKRMFWIVPMALTVALGAVSLPAVPAMAQHGGGEIRLRTALAGTTINGVVAKGKAEARSSSRFKSLKVEAEKVNLADGTVMTVSINGAAVGSFALKGRQGELELNTKDGDTVPAIQAGDVVTVTDPTGTTILTGKF